MYDVERRLRYIKLMQQGKIPEIYRREPGIEKYKTEYEKYTAIYEEIDKCGEQELSNLEILLEHENTLAKGLNDFKYIITLMISICALIFPIFTQLIAIISSASNDSLEALQAVVQSVNPVYCVILLIAITSMGIYTWISIKSNKRMTQSGYLLYILKEVKKKKGIA